MTRSIRLRPWQKAALERFDAATGPDFLAVATPGAGKTTFALTAAVRQMTTAEGPRRLIVVAPTAHLKRQWARAAAAFGLHLDPAWSPTDGAVATDMHGIVTTYQQVAGNAAVLRRLAGPSMVVFDELHHAADDRAWGAAVRHAFEPARRRLALSGTPFRSDTTAIPFLNYVLDEARPDYEYGYGAALADGRVVRPIYFPRTNGAMEWSAPDGSIYNADFHDALDNVRANQRLRTALSLEGDWLPTVLTAAHQRLSDIRRSDPEAGGLVIATDQDHARGIADALAWRYGVRPTIATTDDRDASAHIDRFARSSDPWLVAVRMVSEGVDIPRLRVGVYATTTTTELFFRQAVGRFVRWTRGVPAQRSYLFIPDDARLRARAFQIAEVRRHSLRPDRRDAVGGDGGATERDATDPWALDGHSVGPDASDDQLSLFSVISATATDTDTHGTAHHDDEERLDDEADDPALLLELAALPPLSGASGAGGDDEPVPRRERKQRLRDANAELARDLVRRSGWPHPRVNAELNRLAGIRKVTEATVDQLEKRLRHAERWHARLRA
ncbi:MAG: DEAD/DEAH box helicase [Actinomycetota bacterium]|nr:DEAD/DEAH box helicase [Actinomycetota bacterium]